MEYKIVKYEDKFQKQIKDFLIEITIGEFKFNEWRDYLLNKDFSPYKTNDSIFYIIIDENGEIIATCGGLKKDEETIKLNSFYVKKEFRGKGLGKQLYNLVYKFAKEREYKKILLCTFEKFEIANKFYKKENFVLKEVIGDEQWKEKNI